MEENTDFTRDRGCPEFWSVYKRYVKKHLEMLNQYIKCPFVDPDLNSEILQKAHTMSWSRTLPNGQEMSLKPKKEKEEDGWVLKWGDDNRYGSDIIVTSFISYNWKEKKCDMFIKEIENTEEFYRNIGSFTIFPKHENSINQSRGRSPIYDRFDLTLECIRKYYNQQESLLSDVLKNDSNFFQLFNNFKGYVDFFCFQDLVDDDYTRVRDLMRGGFVNEKSFASPLPENVAEYEQWMNNQLKFVKERTKRIKPLLLIASDFTYNTKDENGVRTPCKIPDKNGILTFIDRYTHGRKCLLVIANDPNDYEDNDNVAQVLGQAFAMTNRKFDEVKVLDNRTRDQTETLIKNANLIFMRGGEIIRQLEFLQQINFKELIQTNRGVVISVSAASMCLTKTICNFPEHEKELNQKRLIDGLGLVDVRLIPHFDGENSAYQGYTDFSNLVQDYILPYSDEYVIDALPNGSFIMYDGNELQFFGPYYQIDKRKIKRGDNEKY